MGYSAEHVRRAFDRLASRDPATLTRFPFEEPFVDQAAQVLLQRYCETNGLTSPERRATTEAFQSAMMGAFLLGYQMRLALEETKDAQQASSARRC